MLLFQKRCLAIKTQARLAHTYRALGRGYWPAAAAAVADGGHGRSARRPAVHCVAGERPVTARRRRTDGREQRTDDSRHSAAGCRHCRLAGGRSGGTCAYRHDWRESSTGLAVQRACRPTCVCGTTALGNSRIGPAAAAAAADNKCFLTVGTAPRIASSACARRRGLSPSRPEPFPQHTLTDGHLSAVTKCGFKNFNLGWVKSEIFLKFTLNTVLTRK